MTSYLFDPRCHGHGILQVIMCGARQLSSQGISEWARPKHSPSPSTSTAPATSKSTAGYRSPRGEASEYHVPIPSTRSFLGEIRQKKRSVDCVICSAGVISILKLELAVDGIEIHLETNQLGRFLSVSLIMGKIIAVGESSSATGGGRITAVSSVTYMNSAVRFSDYNLMKPQSEFPIGERPNV